ncbi:MAG: hypothetical protein WA383_21295 [Terriglobales bacterium]
MQTATIKFNELEWRSDAVQAAAGRMISNVAKHSELAFLHLRFLGDLRSINEKMIDLLAYMHSPEAISILESAAPEELDRVSMKMHDVHSKMRVLILEVRSADLGFWNRVYVSRLNKLEASNHELCSHVEAFRAANSSLILLSKRDQEFLLESLMAPAEPNDALRRAFMKKSGAPDNRCA